MGRARALRRPAAIRFITESCHTPIKVTDVAERVGVSVRTLQNRFAEVLGRTVADEIARIRMEMVKHELTMGEASLEQIARKFTFKTSTELCRAFGRVVGQTPGEYRRQRSIHV